MEFVTASPKGGVAPVDPSSVEKYQDAAPSSSFYKTQSALWKNTAPISSFLGRSSEFAALYYPGGHGPMFDLVGDDDSIALITEFVQAGKPVAAVCHGPIVFTDILLPPEGRHILMGKEITGFSNEEEEGLGMLDDLPFLLEDRIKEAGGQYKKAPKPWEPFVVVDDDGKFITGQNPDSSKGVGEALAKAIGL